MPAYDNCFAAIGDVLENFLDEFLEVIVLEVVLDFYSEGVGQRLDGLRRTVRMRRP